MLLNTMCSVATCHTYLLNRMADVHKLPIIVIMGSPSAIICVDLFYASEVYRSTNKIFK